jgi:hypothetical protein
MFITLADESREKMVDVATDKLRDYLSIRRQATLERVRTNLGFRPERLIYPLWRAA